MLSTSGVLYKIEKERSLGNRNMLSWEGKVAGGSMNVQEMLRSPGWVSLLINQTVVMSARAIHQ